MLVPRWVAFGGRHKEHDLVAHIHVRRRLDGVWATDQHGAAPDGLSGYHSPAEASRGAEARGVLPASGSKNQPGASRLQPPPGNGIPLKRGLEPEASKLISHVLGSEVEPPAGRVAAHHGIVRDDANAACDISGGDRCRGLGRGRRGLGRHWGDGKDEAEQGQATHACSWCGRLVAIGYRLLAVATLGTKPAPTRQPETRMVRE